MLQICGCPFGLDYVAWKRCELATRSIR